MANSPLVLVASTQLNEFKALSKDFFKILDRDYSLPKTPIRKGLDLFSMGLGYSSHPALVTKAKGVNDTLSLPSKIHANFDQVLNSLAIATGVNEEIVSSILSVLLPQERKSITSFIDKLSAFRTAKPEYKFAAKLHKLWLTNDFDAVRELVSDHQWTVEELESEYWYLFDSLNRGCHIDLEVGLRVGMFKDQDMLNGLLYKAIKGDHLDCCFVLIKYGADLNANVVFDSIDHHLVFEALLHPTLSPLLEHAITHKLISPRMRSRGLLESLAGESLSQMVVIIDQISTDRERKATLQKACRLGNGYLVAFLLNEYSNLSFDTYSCLEDFSGDFVELISLLRIFESFGIKVSPLDLCSAIRRSFPEKANKAEQEFLESFLSFMENGKKPLSIDVCNPEESDFLDYEIDEFKYDLECLLNHKNRHPFGRLNILLDNLSILPTQ